MGLDILQIAVLFCAGHLVQGHLESNSFSDFEDHQDEEPILESHP